MQMRTNNYNLFALILTSVSLCLCFGCSSSNADSKAEIDHEVYQIIDIRFVVLDVFSHRFLPSFFIKIFYIYITDKTNGAHKLDPI